MEDKEKLTSYETVKKWVEAPAMLEMFQRTLPKEMDAEAWTGAALAYIRTAKDMQNADPLSITGGLITIASLGVRLDGVMGHAYLTARPIKEKKGREWVVVRVEAQVQLGYKGMLVLAYRNQDIQEIESIIVHQADEFDFQKGTQQFLTHRWKFNEPRGDMIAVYAGVRFKNGYYSFQPFDIDDVMDLRATILHQNGIRIEETTDGPVYHKKQWGGEFKVMDKWEIERTPWIGHLRPMVQKTAVRWGQKFWPTIGTDFARAAALVAMDDAGISQGLASTAAELMPKELQGQVRAQQSFDPGAAQAPQVRSRVRGDNLTARMVAEATAGKEDRAEAGAEEPPKSKAKEEPKAGKKAKAKDAPAPVEKKDDLKRPSGASRRPQEGREKSKGPGKGDPKKGDQGPTEASPEQKEPNPPAGSPSEMTEAEMEEAMIREQEEWEQNLKDRGRTK